MLGTSGSLVQKQSLDSVLNILSHYAEIINAFPTIIVLMMILLAVLMWRRGIIREAVLPSILFLLFLLLPTIFALGGLPGSIQFSRYYSININMILINTIVLLSLTIRFELKTVRIKRSIATICIASILFFFVELGLYSPNLNAFSPTWLIRSSELRTVPRYGKWFIGEPYQWATDFGLASVRINEYYRRQGLSGREYYLWTNFGIFNLGDGKAHRVLSRDLTEQHFTDSTWFNFDRWRLRSRPIPSFVFEVEPLLKIQYRGMTSQWIYRGDQLIDYMHYFLGD